MVGALMKKYLVLACLCGLLCLTGCMKQDEKDFMLAQAVQKSNVKEVQKWLKKKANPNAHFDYFTNEGGKEEVTPLLLTMLTQNTEIAQLLIKAGANVNEQIGEKKAFALLLASGHHYNAQMVQLLLQAGANPNLTDYNGETPLMYASLIHENTEIIKLLL